MVVEPDCLPNGQPVTSVAHLDTIFRAAHLMPVFCNHPTLSKCQCHEQTLEFFSEFYIMVYESWLCDTKKSVTLHTYFNSVLVLTQCHYNSSKAAAATASIVFPFPPMAHLERHGSMDTEKLCPSNTIDPETALSPSAPVDTPFKHLEGCFHT